MEKTKLNNIISIPPSYPELKNVIKYSFGSSSLEKIDEIVKSYDQGNKPLHGYLIQGKLVGVIGVDISNPNQLIIQHISVLKEYRNKGIGAELIDHIKAIYRQLICAETDEEAIGFYQAIDFECDSFINDKGILRYKCVIKNNH